MDLKLFFSPVAADLINDDYNQNSLYKSIYVFGETMPDLRNKDLAIIGIDEVRGDSLLNEDSGSADSVRRKLYSLKKGTGSYNIIDLGNLRRGVTLDDTYLKIKEVCRYLLEKEILPILIGGSHDLDYGQYMAYEEMEKLVSVLNIDAKLDMEEEGGDFARSHIQKILLHDPNYLFHYSQLAYHSYLVDDASLNVLGKLGFDAHRIGGIRKDTEEIEPVIRNADMLSFDIQAIRGSNAPGQQDPLPFGLSGEEACQICWYAGINEKLSSFGIYGFHPNRDVHGSTSMIIATMLWYFIEGYYHRKKELSFAMNDYLRYVVSMPDDPETLVFYKSKVSEKWWLEVPGINTKSFFARERIIPCSYADYETANRGEVPERYITSVGKLS